MSAPQMKGTGTTGTGTSGPGTRARDDAIRELRRKRPRNRFARWSGIALLALAAFSWTRPELQLDQLFRERSSRNLERFLGEVRPYPLQGKAWDGDVFGRWLSNLLDDGVGRKAVLGTLALAVAAICLAGLVAFLTCLFAARNIAHPEPFLPAARPPPAWRAVAWSAVVWATRLVYILARAIPEWIWAFLLLTLLGLGVWPAVLALAVHNSGILGRLYAEVVENLPARTPRALRGLGASRWQIATVAIYPAAQGRFLLYFFYRWETCVREATILGLLGTAGLGRVILQANAGDRWDETVVFILLGSLLIIAGDVVSGVARGIVRRAR